MGVSISALSGVLKPGVNSEEVKLPTASSTAADFGGILIRTDTGHTDANGKNYMAHKEMATVLRSNRVGGRVWVKAYNTITTGGNLYWIIDNSVNSGQPIGGFAGSAISSSSDVDTVQLTNAKVVSGAAAGGLALIEILG